MLRCDRRRRSVQLRRKGRQRSEVSALAAAVAAASESAAVATTAAAAAARMKVTVVTGRRKRRRIRRRQITRLHQGVAVAVIIITGVHFAVAAIDVVAVYGCVVDIYDRRTGTTMIVAVVEDVVTVAYVVT